MQSVGGGRGNRREPVRHPRDRLCTVRDDKVRRAIAWHAKVRTRREIRIAFEPGHGGSFVVERGDVHRVTLPCDWMMTVRRIGYGTGAVGRHFIMSAVCEIDGGGGRSFWSAASPARAKSATSSWKT